MRTLFSSLLFFLILSHVQCRKNYEPLNDKISVNDSSDEEDTQLSCVLPIFPEPYLDQNKWRKYLEIL
jgi:hypothetical protein